MARRVAREEYERLCWMIKKWNHNRLELFEITIPNEVNARSVIENVRCVCATRNVTRCSMLCTVSSVIDTSELVCMDIYIPVRMYTMCT